ncbi:glycoside hydrolase family 73 protein [Acidocella sp.]|uniref:glycoside hydrolase family 73 protein n=1 Tax=Acidocella sp. TaxID=50710 RepID=UPI00260BB772|nr:glucosaminidase domain-containing protein [Acidocella sp.]
MNISGAHLITSPEISKKQAAQKLVGELWYDMLAELDKTTGGYQSADTGNFQDMMNWQVSESDFSAYDKSLVDAIMASIDGKHDVGGVLSSRIINNMPLSEDLVAGSMAAMPSTDTMSLVGSDEKWANLASAIWPAVRKISADLNIPAVGILSQIALETGWGSATPGNNLFGIKAIKGEPGQSLETQEWVNGTDVNELANFRSYRSVDAALSDYARLIHMRYSKATNSQTVAEFADALQNSGYATDSNYAQKIIDISNSDRMKRLVLEVSGATNR